MTEELCIVCRFPVTARQHAVACDTCDKWQHRTCDTGISLVDYRQAVRSASNISFTCQQCTSENDITDITDITEEINQTNFNISITDITEETNVSIDQSFDLPERQRPEEAREPQEESFEVHEPAEDSILTDQPTTYEILPTGTTRGKPLLVSSDGYTYAVKRTNKASTMWTCTIRSKKIHCYASVVSKGDQYQRGPQQHIHPPEPKKPAKARVTMKAKQIADENLFQPSMSIVESSITNELDAEHRFLAPKRGNLKRVVNLHRARRRPQEPADLGFELNKDFLQCDDFIVADITADNQRHLIFATEFQLRILRQAKQWFLDGTFKAVPPAFGSGQLFSIHAFVHINGKKKQFPLVFAIMSRRRKSDYVRVLTSVRDRLGDCQVEMCMLDFEQAAWQAIRDVFPEVNIRGCVFHLTQAWWRHIQELGLARTYRERGATHNFLRMILALPFLPPHQIQPTFETVTMRCPDDTSHPLRKFVDYVEAHWIESTLHPPSTWSAFEASVRTNNDVEGWHHRLNRKTNIHPALYILVPLLKKEAETVHAQVTAEDLDRHQRTAYTSIEKKLTEATHRYMAREITTSAFLKTVSGMYTCGRDMIQE